MLLWQLPHHLSHVLQGELRGVCFRCLDDGLDLIVHISESLKKVHVPQLNPEFVLITQVHNLVIYFDRAVAIDAIFYVDDIRLIEKVVHDRRDQVESAIEDQKATARLFDSALVGSLIELFEEAVEDACEDAGEFAVVLVLDERVLHVDRANREQTIRELLDQGHQNFTLLDDRLVATSVLNRWIRLVLDDKEVVPS